MRLTLRHRALRLANSVVGLELLLALAWGIAGLLLVGYPTAYGAALRGLPWAGAALLALAICLELAGRPFDPSALVGRCRDALRRRPGGPA